MVTPYTKDTKQIDFPALVQFTKWLNTQKVDLLFPISGLGQWREITDKEKKQIIETVVKYSTLPVSPGITSLKGLDETVSLAVFAQNAGAKSITLALPPFHDSDVEARWEEIVLKYLSRVNNSLKIPILLYDHQGHISPEFIGKIHKFRNIKALKYRTKDMIKILRATHIAKEKIAILIGVEHLTLPA